MCSSSLSNYNDLYLRLPVGLLSPITNLSRGDPL